MAPFESHSAESHANYVRIPCIVFFVITPVFVGIRIYNRISRRTGLGWDDGTIILSFVRWTTSIGDCHIPFHGCFGNTVYLGMHSGNHDPDDVLLQPWFRKAYQDYTNRG
jgi:hypothetical protein